MYERELWELAHNLLVTCEKLDKENSNLRRSKELSDKAEIVCRNAYNEEKTKSETIVKCFQLVLLKGKENPFEKDCGSDEFDFEGDYVD